MLVWTQPTTCSFMAARLLYQQMAIGKSVHPLLVVNGAGDEWTPATNSPVVLSYLPRLGFMSSFNRNGVTTFLKKNPLLRYKPMDTYSEWIYLTLFIYRYIFIINAYSYLSEPMIKGRPDLISTGTAGVYRGSVMTRPPSCTPGPVTPRPPSYPKVHTHTLTYRLLMPWAVQWILYSCIWIQWRPETCFHSRMESHTDLLW